MKKVLFVATVVKTHIMEFHIPYLKMFKEMGWETAVAARNDYENPSDCVIPYCDTYYDIPFERNPLKLGNMKAYKRLEKVIDDGGYDIIHCHTPVGAMLTVLPRRRQERMEQGCFIRHMVSTSIKAHRQSTGFCIIRLRSGFPDIQTFSSQSIRRTMRGQRRSKLVRCVMFRE